MGLTGRERIGRLLIGFLIGLPFALPLYWALIVSLQPLGTPPPRSIVWWPTAAAWENYRLIFEIVPFGRYIGNSILVSAIAVPVTWLVASLSGFAISRLPFAVRRVLVPVTTILLIIPAVALWIMRFRFYEMLGILDTLWALIAPAFMGGNPLYVLLFYWTYRRVPDDLFDAAQIDGATWLQIWRHIGLPLARPTSLAVIVLAFLKFWSDFTDPVLYVFDTGKYTLPVGLQLLKQLDQTNVPLLMVGAIFMTIPVLIVFLTMQRIFWRRSTLVPPTSLTAVDPTEPGVS